ncbi:MAG: DnaJ family molecular chaperone [Rhizobiales bacterium]|nr:DnaJ family molecular chaperone [Hyphomicrobiales bacterium]MBI3672874.1 DnaJ family molecular chaperone [Hyphomicrobiales bacterium]
MSIWSRIAEILSAIGDGVGSLLKALSPRRPAAPEKSVAFTIGMIALGAKMAKADGAVTAAEIAAFKQVFQVPDGELANVARVFNLAKQDVAGYDAYARRIARLFKVKSPVLEDVLDGLFHIAKADDAIHAAELAFLADVAAIFGFSEAEFTRISSRHVAGTGDPWMVLGLEPGTTFDVVRQRYRKLVRENHPDRHIAAGVPAEMIRLATERLQRINEAYAEILRRRAA